ncbi:type II toxin-antitoxin system RelE/ParE family toxin [Candidatus Woesearchaeota archaeon]|nr:type II toxin-antitoxin system RelE/ParE family toxin [Candidatus Woesearchaeota archaeon]
MNFAIDYDKQPEKFLIKLDKHLSQRIIDKIEECLQDYPVPSNAVAISWEHGVFRLRIGDFRALYRINHTENKIIVLKVDKRERVYD